MSQNLFLAKNTIIDRIEASLANEKSTVFTLRKKPRKEEKSLRQELVSMVTVSAAGAGAPRSI